MEINLNISLLSGIVSIVNCSGDEWQMKKQVKASENFPKFE